jgi:hypothetical protein
LPLAEFWYNTSYPSAIGHSPFEVLHGYQPRHFGIQEEYACPMQHLDSWLQDRKLMTDVIRQHLQRAQIQMKTQADKKRSDVQFAVGDKVFLKLQPYIQSSLARRANKKLAFKFFGPYEIIVKIGFAAYELALPNGSTVHPIFHVSQLKKMVNPS